jgi:uncharacterized protein YndB with AHSA1/START domain
MSKLDISDSKIIKYQIEVPINRSIEQLWTVMTEEIDLWWMNDFRALGEGSKVSLDPQVGGMLIESDDSGGSLEWYRVQMATPLKSLYLVGYLAPDWGGPTTSMLKLALEADGDSSKLVISDALMGNVTDKSAGSAMEGWQMLFDDGLKKHAEAVGS